MFLLLIKPEFVLCHRRIVVVTQNLDGSLIIFNPEDDESPVPLPRHKRIKIFNIYIIIAKHIQNVGQSSCGILERDSQYRSYLEYIIRIF